MTALGFLASRTLRRNPVRTALVVLGLCVTGALLLDMTMLAGGLEASLGQLLGRLGFAIRVVPKGTLPFSGDAQIPDADRLAAGIAGRPGVTAAVPVVATNVYVGRGRATFASFALGVPDGGSGVYTVLQGRDLPSGGRDEPPNGTGATVAVVVNRNMAHLDGVRIGDDLVLSGAPVPGLNGASGSLRARVVGIADFYVDLATQRSIALRTMDLRRVRDVAPGAASLILVRISDPARVGAVVAWTNARDPRVDALSVGRFIARAGGRLTYFNQFALILSTLSLAVSFLLITAIVTLSLGERLGEIAVLRALGMTRSRVGAVIVLEGVALSVVSLPGAFLLGLGISGNLDAILRGAPGVPESLHFFTLTAAAVTRTVALLIGTGAAGGLYPAVVASRLRIATTLHAEVQS
ncbi:MAG TPA: FtsX-like permease family protein [bacterium]|nr:FtsX-like permease family protein [bacterium]